MKTRKSSLRDMARDKGQRERKKRIPDIGTVDYAEMEARILAKCAKDGRYFGEGWGDAAISGADYAFKLAKEARQARTFTRYDIIATDSVRDLKQDIEMLMADGWELQGGVAVTCAGSNRTYYQALAKRG